MNTFFGIIMFICLVPTIWITYSLLYPRKWREKKLIFGVTNRKEFTEPEVSEKIDSITDKNNKAAFRLNIVFTVISVVLLFLGTLPMRTFIWVMLVFIAVFAISVPYIFGNKEMKALKKSLGLIAEKGISYTDLKTVGTVRALKPGSVILPNIVGILTVIIALLADLKIIKTSDLAAAGTFLATSVCGSIFLVGIMITIIGFVMDRIKSEVISTDSDINANYNRAKKKNMAKMFVLMLWANSILGCALSLLEILSGSGIVMIAGIGLYMILVMGALAIFVHTDQSIEKIYHKDMTVIQDDDDFWIAGMFYYNPSDKRLNVEKRAGVGSTINMAHPAGKVIGFLAALSIVFSILVIIWVGMLESTPISLRVSDGNVICHQLRDEYVIPVSDIESVEYIEDIRGLRFVRTNGTGMETLLKGNFSVEGEACKVFLAPDKMVAIKIVTSSGKIYYISSATPSETCSVYAQLNESL
ncbi:MAG: hypothetical protein KBG42_04755 [Lachnospiraceae bacterium]|nr:hypothetical protein [Lachnospiraceae bacterium]